MSVLGDSTDLLSRGFDEFERIGRGGSGTVYRARDTRLNRNVAIKVLNGEGSTERIAREARAQSILSWHANVLSLHDIGVTPDGSEYLVLELAEGGSLADRVRTTGPLRGEALRRLAAELASALAAAHAAGVVHCDVKPSNVLFAADGSVRLADFGISRASHGAAVTLDDIEGSVAFSPPELLEGGTPGSPNDLYGAALTVWYAATGEQPYDSAFLPASVVAARIQTQRLEFPGDTGLPATAVASLEAALEKDPERRPTARELHGALPPSRSVPQAHQRAGIVSRRWKRGVVGLLVLSLLVGIAIARESESPPSAAPEVDLCSEYASFVDARITLLDEVSADLEQAKSPVDVADRLLRQYPAEFASGVRPFLATVSAMGGTEGEVTASQLAAMTTADNLRSLSGGKPFLYDGQSGNFEAAGLPQQLHAPARIFSDANEYAASQCPEVKANFAPAKARLASAVYSNLADPTFMDQFFADPRSIEIFDTATAILMASMSWSFFERLLEGRWEWFMEVMERNDDLRRALSLEYPEILLRAGSRVPTMASTLASPEWVEPLRSGVERASTATRAGMWSEYPELMTMIGAVRDG